MNSPDVIPELLSNCQQYQQESYEDAMLRYQGIGKGLYALIRAGLPQIFTHLTFYKAAVGSGICAVDEAQTLDSYAVYADGSHSFAIQLEPEGGVIGIWNDESEFFEAGYWSENPEDEIIHFIGQKFGIK